MRSPIVVLALALGGCSGFEAVKPEAEPPRPETTARPSTGQELVSYLGLLRTMSESALSIEAARRKAEESDLSHVKSALALSLSPQVDEAEILTLVDGPSRSANDRDVRTMASFLQAMALERRKLRESANSAGAKLREERRSVEAQRQRAESLQQRAEALQQKLDALTDLEKSLADRQTTNPR
jgi:hypothetical protein